MTAALVVAPFAMLASTPVFILAGAMLAAARPTPTKENHVHPHQ